MTEVACLEPIKEEEEAIFVWLIQILFRDFPELLRDVLKSSTHHTQVADLLKGLRFRVNKSIWFYSADNDLDKLDLSLLIQILNILPEFGPLRHSLESLRHIRNELCHLPSNAIHKEKFMLVFHELGNIADDIEDYLGRPRKLSLKFQAVWNKWRLYPRVKVNPSVHSTVVREEENEPQEIQQKEDEARRFTTSTELREKEVKLHKPKQKAVPLSQYMISTELRGIERKLDEIQAKIGKTLEKEDHNFFDNVHENSISTGGKEETKLDVYHTNLQYTREIENEKLTSSTKVLSPRNDQSSSTRISVNPRNVEDKPNNGDMFQKSTVDLPDCENGAYANSIQLSCGLSVVSQDSGIGVQAVKSKHQKNSMVNSPMIGIKTLPMSQSVMPLPASMEVSVKSKRKGKRLFSVQDLLLGKTKYHITLLGISTKNKNRRMRLIIRQLSDGDSTDSLYSPKHVSTPRLERLLHAKTNFKWSRTRKKDRCTCYEALGIELRTPINPRKCYCKGLEPCGDVGILHSDANEDRESAMKLQHQLMVIRPEYQIETQDTILLPGQDIFNINEFLNYRRIFVLVTPFYNTESATVLRHRVKMILRKEPKKIIAVFTEDIRIADELSPLQRIKLFQTLKNCRRNNFILSSNHKERLGRLMDNVCICK